MAEFDFPERERERERERAFLGSISQHGYEWVNLGYPPSSKDLTN